VSTTAPPLPTLNLLVPHSATFEPDALEAELRRWYAYPDPIRGRSLVRATMVSSADGGAWGADHLSGTINNAADGRVFAVLRSLADVVLVGAGTARAERYNQLEVAGLLAQGRTAPLETAVVTGSGHVPSALTGGTRPAFVVTGRSGADAARSAVAEDRIIAVDSIPEGGLDLAMALAALADRGLTRVLCEGGPLLLGALWAQDLLDELCLTTTPTLVGAGPSRIVAGAQGPATEVRPATLAHLLHASGTLLARWTVPIG
jgi:riboflavin biosynthesis pyrimidine reductase